MNTSTTPTITAKEVEHVAKLANIPVSNAEIDLLASAFSETLGTISNLQEINTTELEPTHQVTGLTNVFRADEVNTDSQFSQDEALANAPAQHNGYFVVPRVIDTDE